MPSQITIPIEDMALEVGRLLSELEQQQAARWADWTLTIIENRLGDLTALNQDTLRMVVTEVVADRIKRPEKETQTSVTIDNGTVNRTYSPGGGRITITDDQWRLLSPAKTGRAFTIAPSLGEAR
jgi:hypothetical protein